MHGILGIKIKRYQYSPIEVCTMKKCKWYECRKCHQQGYVSEGGHPNEWVHEGCSPDAKEGPHEWKYIGSWATDFKEYPEDEYNIG